MKVRVFDIIYCITPEDLVGSDMNVREVAAGLPSVLILDVDSVDDVAEAITDKTGWLVEVFEIDVM